jgi:gamma-glutamylcyclotransferase (GGCT)/AIG2-like uncharacterized protein YtfP
VTAYFAYGTTQRGFPHWHERRALLGEPLGRFRTVAPHAVVVPREAACGNPGCRFVHRMAALVPGEFGLHAEGDVFLVGADALAALDELELGGPYTRAELAVAAGARRLVAVAYPAREPRRWAELVRAGHADALAVYPPALAGAAALKACCAAAPGHAPPHDVLDPLLHGASG